MLEALGGNFVLDAPPEASEKTTALMEPETGGAGRFLAEKGSDLVGVSAAWVFASGDLVLDGGGLNLGAFPLDTLEPVEALVSEVARSLPGSCSEGGVEPASGVAAIGSAMAGVGVADGTGLIWLSP